MTLFCQGILRGLIKGRGVLRTLSLHCLPTLSQSQTLRTTFVTAAFDLPGVAGLWPETFPFLSQHLPFIPTFILEVMGPNALPSRLSCPPNHSCFTSHDSALIHPRALDNLKLFVSKGEKKMTPLFYLLSSDSSAWGTNMMQKEPREPSPKEHTF